MTRHGLQLPHPAITTTLETRTLTSVANPNRKMLRWSAKTLLRDMTSHRKCAWLTRPAHLPGSARPVPQTPPNPKSP